MNQKQLHYAIELAEVCNFSKVSEKLNITQPALSKQIILLEKELGVQLFDRSSTPLCLTRAGEYFIKEAKDLLYKEEQLIRSMESFASGERGILKIGVSPFRSLYLIPSIVKNFKKRYPNVEIRLYDTNSEQIRKEISDGKIDFAIVNLPVDESLVDYVPIESDILVLAVPNVMLDMIQGVPAQNLSEVNFSSCRDLPFVVVEKSKEMRGLFDKLCASADFCPNISMEVVGITTAWAMAQAGVGATLVPLQFIGDDAFDNGNVTFLKIKDNPYSRQPVIVTRRGQYVSEYAKYAIELLQGKK